MTMVINNIPRTTATTKNPIECHFFIQSQNEFIVSSGLWFLLLSPHFLLFFSILLWNDKNDQLWPWHLIIDRNSSNPLIITSFDQFSNQTFQYFPDFLIIRVVILYFTQKLILYFKNWVFNQLIIKIYGFLKEFIERNETKISFQC